MMTTNPTLESCEVRNSERCLLLTPQGHCGPFYDEDGILRLCCYECDPPVEYMMTDDEIEEMRQLAELEED